MAQYQIGDVLGGLQPVNIPGHHEHHSNYGYHPRLSPPDFVLVKKHARANRIYADRHDKSLSDETCPCCGHLVEGKEIPLFAGPSKLYHLGSGYALYFRFIKLSIILLVIVFAVGGFYNMISNNMNDDCYTTEPNGESVAYCMQDYISSYAIANKGGSPKALHAQYILNLIVVVIIVLFFHYIRYELRKMILAADDKTVTPSDYTVKLSGVPHSIRSGEIREWMQSQGKEDDPIQVRKIIRSFDLVEFNKLNSEKDALADQRDNETIPETRMELEYQIQTVKQKLANLRQKGLKYAGAVFVTFRTAQQANFIENKFTKSLVARGADRVANAFKKSDNRLTRHNVKVKRAPEPSDVLWENLGFTKPQKAKRKHLTTLLSALFVLLSFGVIFCLTWAQGLISAQNGKASPVIKMLSMGASLVIVLVNYFLGQLIRKLAEYEKHGTFTGFFTGVAKKLSAAQFINTAFTVLLAKLIVTSDIFVAGQVKEGWFNFYGQIGLVESIFYVFISNAFVTPLMTFFDPFYLLKRFQIWRVLNHQKDTKLNQEQAHKLFEGMEIDMSYKNALLIKTMLLTFFYAPIVPAALLFAIVGLVLVYWVDKYVFLRRCKLPFALEDELTRNMIEYMEWIALMYSLGNLVAYFTLLNPKTGQLASSESSVWLIIIPIAISLVHIVFPMDYLNKRLFPLIDEVTEFDSYDSVRYLFETDYQIENPVTRKQGLQSRQKAQLNASAGLHREEVSEDFEDEHANLLCLSSDEEGEEEGLKKNIYEIESPQTQGIFQSLEGYLQNTRENPYEDARENKIGRRNQIKVVGNLDQSYRQSQGQGQVQVQSQNQNQNPYYNSGYSGYAGYSEYNKNL